MEERKKFKEYFDQTLAVELAEKIVSVHPSFQDKEFIEAVSLQITDLELKARVAVFAEEIKKRLPAHYPDALALLVSILGPENPEETGMFDKWYWLMPVAFFVETYGTDHPEPSIAAIAEITKRFTGEYAIRPYIEKYPAYTMDIMEQWSNDQNFHLRRLASEGCRPRLPWAKKLDPVIADPSLTSRILENLKEDSVMFVKKSVANHLNDILKDNYQFGIKVIRRWSDTENDHTKWMIRHALRNQRKKENPEALMILKKISKKV